MPAVVGATFNIQLLLIVIFRDIVEYAPLQQHWPVGHSQNEQPSHLTSKLPPTGQTLARSILRSDMYKQVRNKTVQQLKYYWPLPEEIST